jgi:hypothetical protein
MRNAGKVELERYNMKHFVVFRDDPKEHEIPPSHVRLVDRPLVGGHERQAVASKVSANASPLAEQRVKDSEFFGMSQPELRPFRSKDSGGV